MVQQLGVQHRRVWHGWILLGIWLGAAVLDRVWLAIVQPLPTWDSAGYLVGAMNYWQALQHPDWTSASWWHHLWMLSSKMPPLVYLATVPFLQILGLGVTQSMGIYLAYSALLLGAIYGLGVSLFSAEVGLWAAAITGLLPGLYSLKFQFLLDYPIATIVTLCFLALTAWWLPKNSSDSIHNPRRLNRLTVWLKVAAFGITFGLAFLTKQTAIQFLLVPLAWIVFRNIIQRQWERLIQLLVGLAIGVGLCFPWYSTNWLIILTSGERATIEAAAAEGDPGLNTIEAWVYYLKSLPNLIGHPLFWVALGGLILAGQQAIKHKTKLQEIFTPQVRWLLIFLGGAYLFCSLNVNKDDRYLAPMLPMLSLVIAQALLVFPRSLRSIRWGSLGLATVWMLANLWLPFPGSARTGIFQGNWQQRDVAHYLLTQDPYIRHTVGVLPSLAPLNQHTFDYYGTLENFQVYGRQVGTRLQHASQDSRSLNWYLLKTGDQGSIRKPESLAALTQAIVQSPDLTRDRTWHLPDGSLLQLYHRQQPFVSTQAISGNPIAQVQLTQVQVPPVVPPGQPIPVSYQWLGSWQDLRSGLVLLTWQPKTANSPAPTVSWIHDHAIGLGLLAPDVPNPPTLLQVTEHTAMLPPPNASGEYTLTATYLDRDRSYAIDVPPIQLTVDPQAPPIATPELDPVTQLRTIAQDLPKGIPALPQVFEQIGRINQYDPIQDYVAQTQRALTDRLQHNPHNLALAYNLALAHILSRDPDRAIATFQQVQQLDPQNPNVYAYLAFLHLYKFQGQPAQAYLHNALQLSPNQPEFHGLNAIAHLFQGHLLRAWQEAQRYRQPPQA